MERSSEGNVVLSLKQVALVVGLVSAVWALAYPAYRWIFGVDRVVYEEFPSHVETVKATTKALEAVAQTQNTIAQIRQQENDEELREQIAYELKCANPKTDLPRDFCADVLAKQREREAGLRGHR